MSIRLLYTHRFLKSAKRLPRFQQAKLASQLKLCQSNPFTPTLHTKALGRELTGFYSFRITRDWRVMFQFLDPRTIKLLDVDHRRNIYNR